MKFRPGLNLQYEYHTLARSVVKATKQDNGKGQSSSPRHAKTP